MRPFLTARAAELLIVAAVGVILVATLSPLDTAASGSGWNWLPFRDLLTGRSRLSAQLATADLVRNVALYVPLGVALALRLPRTGALALTLVAAGLSLGVEHLQGATIGRVSDVTDVLMNALGALVGVAGLRLVAGSGDRRTGRST